MCNGYSYAQELPPMKGIRVLNLRLHPYISTTVAYDDNIWSSSGTKTDDIITTVKPGLLIDVPYYKHSLKIDTYARKVSYTENPDANYLSYTFKSSLELRYNKFDFDAAELFDQPYATTYGAGYAKYNYNKFQAILKPKFRKLGFELSYANVMYDYERSRNSLDYIGHEYTITGLIQAFPKTQILFEYDYGRQEYKNNRIRNSARNEFWFGFRNYLSGKLIGVAKAGMQLRDYDDSSQDDWIGYIALADLTYITSERNSIRLILESKPFESTFGATTSGYYKQDKISLQVKNKLTQRLTGTITGSYTLDKYSKEITSGGVTDKQENKRPAFETELEFKPKRWLTANFKYNYTDQDSNFNTNDYTDNKFTFGVDIAF